MQVVIESIWDWFEWLLRRRRRRRFPTRIVFKHLGMKVKFMNLKVSQALPVNIVLEDEFGNPTGAVDAPPAWSVSDATLGAVVSAADGLSATFTPSGKLGDASLQVLATAGGKTLAGTLPVTLIPGDATQVVISAGTPVDAPAPTPAA